MNRALRSTDVELAADGCWLKRQKMGARMSRVSTHLFAAKRFRPATSATWIYPLRTLRPRRCLFVAAGRDSLRVLIVMTGGL